MLRPFCNIVIQQITPFYKNGGSTRVERNTKFTLDFVHEIEVEKGWEKHTDTAKITFPKNVILETGKAMFQQTGTYNVILGGEGGAVNASGTKNELPPLIMRGDSIQIQAGYLFFNEQMQQQKVTNNVFTGFISKVNSQIPIEIECEDNFYLLKRTPVGVSVWGKELISLCQYMVNRANALFHDIDSRYPKLEVSDIADSLTANFSLGHLDIGEVTCSQLLSELRRQYKLESRFIDNTLYFGFPIYDESKATSKYIFEFENNIHKGHSLEYANKGDTVLSAIVNCVTINPTGKHTHDGKAATKRSKKSILIYWDIPTASFKYIVKKKGESFPANEGGERREFIYAIDPRKGEPADSVLFEWGKNQLSKYYYTGFRGSFTTFGYPEVKWGDNIVLMSSVFSDRNGRYKVKKVVFKGSKGLKQEIHLDYIINSDLPTNIKTLSML